MKDNAKAISPAALLGPLSLAAAMIAALSSSSKSESLTFPSSSSESDQGLRFLPPFLPLPGDWLVFRPEGGVRANHNTRLICIVTCVYNHFKCYQLIWN